MGRAIQRINTIDRVFEQPGQGVQAMTTARNYAWPDENAIVVLRVLHARRSIFVT